MPDVISFLNDKLSKTKTDFIFTSRTQLGILFQISEMSSSNVKSPLTIYTQKLPRNVEGHPAIILPKHGLESARIKEWTTLIIAMIAMNDVYETWISVFHMAHVRVHYIVTCTR